MATELATQNGTAVLSEAVEQALIGGDLSKLDARGRINLYNETCRSLNLNPLTQPFQYLTLNGRLVLYATRNCTDQLRAIHNVTVTIGNRERIDDVYVVTARATLPNGRTDESTGAVTLGSLKGDALCNALMKAETKAKRRVTLSIIGLSLLDETEIETIPAARRVEPLDLPAADDAPEAVSFEAIAERLARLDYGDEDGLASVRRDANVIRAALNADEKAELRSLIETTAAAIGLA